MHANNKTQTGSGAEDTRRARKRATDRRAQRDHRQRRKAYVQQLEDSLRSLTEQHNTEERVQALLEENTRLRTEATGLRSKLSQIHSLSSNVNSTDNDSPHTRKEDSPNNEILQPVPRPEGGELQNASAQDHFESTGSDASLSNLDWNPTEPLSEPPVDFLLDTQNTENFPISDSDLFIDDTIQIACTLSSADVNIIPPLSMEEPNLALEIMNPLWNDTALNPMQTIPDFALHHKPNYLQFPRYCNPVGFADRAMSQFLKEAREEHMNSRFDESEPSMARLLSDPPQTILAFRLFHFINRAGSMPLHLFMGIFWVQYLVLRAS